MLPIGQADIRLAGLTEGGRGIVRVAPGQFGEPGGVAAADVAAELDAPPGMAGCCPVGP
jgi:hypothetical protein